MTLAALLRAAQLVIVLVLLALAALLHRAGLPAWAIALLVVPLPVLLHGLPLTIEFITGALRDRPRPRRLSPWRALRLWWRETWRSAVVFNVDQPWRASFAEPALTPGGNRPAVLLIHGYLCNRAVWRRWLAWGAARRWNVATVNLEPVFGPIDDYADVIDRALQRLQAGSGSARVTLVCHSMGGLAARAYLRRYGADAVARLVTIATPHAGTLFARLGHGANARAMRWRGEAAVLDDLGVEFHTFGSRDDNLIVPRGSCMPAGAAATWFDEVGHLAMTADRAVYQAVIGVVEAARSATQPGGAPPPPPRNAQ